MITFPRDAAHVLVEPLRQRPDQEAIVTRSGSTSYRQLDGLGDRAANVLLALGIRPGDRVAACLPNDIDIIAAFHGAMRIGAVWVGVGEGLATPERAYILRDSGAKLLLCEQMVADQLAGHRSELSELTRIVTCDAGAGAANEWRSLLAAQPEHRPEVPIDPSGPAAIAYTSGTTGHPKGALHSQRNLLLPGWYLSITRGYDAGLRKGDCFPLTILNLLVLTTLLTAQAGGCSVVMDAVRSDTVVEWIRRERVAVWNGPPPLLYTLAHDPTVQAADLASLVEVWSGGAECPRAIRQAFEAKFGIRIFSTYGLTEAPTVIAIESPRREHIPGTTGKSLPHLELTIRGAQGEKLRSGESGEICVEPKSPAAIRAALRADWGIELTEQDEPPIYTPMLGYWGRPDDSRHALDGALLRTHDAGVLDEDGNLWFSDRLSQIVNRGGANVYPAEIERVVLELSAVEACAVFGVPDERLGQRVAMLVQLSEDSEPALEALEAVLDHCKSELAPYKIPELVATVEDLPRNAMGKIDRRAVASMGETLVRRVRTRA